MKHSDGESPATRVSVSGSSEMYEIVTPVADAMGALADIMKGNASTLTGASVAKSVSGTLLLNSRAWELFGESLQRELPDLAVVPARPFSKPLRFC